MAIPEGSAIGMIAQNIGLSLQQIAVLGEAVAFVVGVFTAMASLPMFLHQGQGNVPTRLPKALMTLVIGIVFVFLPELFGTGAQTIWGGEATQTSVDPWSK